MVKIAAMTNQPTKHLITFPEVFDLKAFSVKSGIPLRTLTRAKTGEGVGNTSKRLIEQELKKYLKGKKKAEDAQPR